MAGKRTDGQTLIAVAMTVELLAAIDAKRGLVSRSTFVRDSLVQYLKIPPEIAAAPDRAGKGGRPKGARSKEDVNELKQRKHEIEEKLKALKTEAATVMERVSTPEAQDAIMGIKDKKQRLETLGKLKILKTPLEGTGGKKPKSSRSR